MAFPTEDNPLGLDFLMCGRCAWLHVADPEAPVERQSCTRCGGDLRPATEQEAGAVPRGATIPGAAVR